jgi:hypothetical protein
MRIGFDRNFSVSGQTDFKHGDFLCAKGRPTHAGSPAEGSKPSELASDLDITGDVQ